ncbi:MAG: hypothetical protein AAF798_18030 [Bacteroidota bacterium]
MRRLTLFILFIFGIQSLQAGGGWPQPKGHGFFKLSQWWIIADQHFTDTGLIDPNVTNGIFNTSLYAEYGFTDRLTGILNFPFYSRAYFNNTVSATTGEIITPGDAINSLGDTDIGLKYGLLTKGPYVLSATVLFGIPLGENAGGSQGTLQTGDGEFNQLFQLDLGRGFTIGKVNAFANIAAGFNNRTNDFSDELRFSAEFGATFWNNKITAIARITGIESLNNGVLPSEAAAGVTIFANNSEFWSFTPEIAYNINEQWGVSATIGTAFSGRLIYANPSYSFGVFFKL